METPWHELRTRKDLPEKNGDYLATVVEYFDDDKSENTVRHINLKRLCPGHFMIDIFIEDTVQTLTNCFSDFYRHVIAWKEFGEPYNN